MHIMVKLRINMPLLPDVMNPKQKIYLRQNFNYREKVRLNRPNNVYIEAGNT